MILGINGIIAGRGVIPYTLLTNLLSVYKAENNANDSLLNYNGTGQGGLTYSTGKSGDTFNFNGTTSYVHIGNAYNVETNSWTYSFWFNTNQVTGYQTLFSKAVAAGLEGRVWANINVDKIEFNFEALLNSNVITITSNQTININTWYHITCILDRADKLKLYINGTLATVTVTSGTNNLIPYVSFFYTNGSPFRLGTYTASNYTTAIALFNGKLDEFNVWNRVLTPAEITELYRCGSGSFYPYVSLPTIDADACAFTTSASITDNTQVNAINQLVLDLKSANLWTKMKAIYPFVGGTASQHRFNLKDPRPVAGAFYLDFFGGGTHSATGYQANGGTAYADTKLIEATSLNLNDTHISFYSRTNDSSGCQCDIGALDNTTNSNIFPNFANTFYPRIQASNSGIAVSLDTRGLFIANRVNATQVQGWRNTTKYTINSNSTGLTTVPFWIADLNTNNTSGVVRSLKEYAFVTIGYGLTDTDVSNFYTILQAFQTTLGRAV